MTPELKKSFDTVSHIAIKLTLIKAALDEKYINTIMNTLDGATTIIHHKGAKTREI